MKTKKTTCLEIYFTNSNYHKHRIAFHKHSITQHQATFCRAKKEKRKKEKLPFKDFRLGTSAVYEKEEEEEEELRSPEKAGVNRVYVHKTS